MVDIRANMINSGDDPAAAMRINSLQSGIDDLALNHE